jgi:hypothetical protein
MPAPRKKRYPLPKRFNAALSEDAYARDGAFREFIGEYGAPAPPDKTTRND